MEVQAPFASGTISRVLYHSSLAICLAAAIATSWLLAAAFPFHWGVAAMAGYQCAVYLVVAGYAYLSRQHLVASAIVMLMALLVVAVGAAMLTTISMPEYGLLILTVLSLLLLAQAMLAVLGCYLGYALVEGRRLRQYHGANFARGKLLVIGILAAAVAIVAANYFALAR